MADTTTTTELASVGRDEHSFDVGWRITVYATRERSQWKPSAGTGRPVR